MLKHFLAGIIILLSIGLMPCAATAGDEPSDYRLGPGDSIRIQVFQNLDLTLETRVSESGTITYPLLGSVRLGGLTLGAAGAEIARQLKEGGFLQQPQVNVVLVQNRGNQVSVLGQVMHPGRYPLDNFNIRLTEMLAIASGITTNGADVAILTGLRNGQPFRKEVDIPALFLDNRMQDDIVVAPGDVIYVQRAPVFYIYGEAQRPGVYRIERNMTVQQAMALGGGPTVRGTEYMIRLHRRKPDGTLEQLSPEKSDLVQPEDVLYIRESLF